LSTVLVFFKFLYRQKEKIVLVVMIVAFAGVIFVQWKSGENDETGGNKGGNSDNGIQPIAQPKSPAPRKPLSFKTPPAANEYSAAKYIKVVTPPSGGKGIFEKPEKEKRQQESDKPKEWADIKIKNIFDATRSGSYVAIIEVDKRRRFVKEGEQFLEYTVQRIDGVRNCLTIVRRGEEGEKEFCKEK
jgi:hypothetical protein